MSNLRELINNQTIRIDDHKRGSGEEMEWDSEDKDVHIDKITHNRKIKGKIQNVRIRIPINSEREIKVCNNNKGKVPKILEKEIKRAFDNKEVRDRFIRDLVDILKNFKTVLKDEARASDVLRRLSNHFGLNWTGEKIANYVEGALSSYTQKYTNENKEYSMTVDKKKIEIEELPQKE